MKNDLAWLEMGNGPGVLGNVESDQFAGEIVEVAPVRGGEIIHGHHAVPGRGQMKGQV